MRPRQTDVLVQEADEGGGHDVPVFAAELHGRLDPVVHHQSEVLVYRVRTVIGKLKQEIRVNVKANLTGLVLVLRVSLPLFLDTLGR